MIILIYAMTPFIVNCFMAFSIFGLVPVIGYVALTDIIDSMTILVILGIIIFGGSVLLDIAKITSIFQQQGDDDN